jgi:hypothetical protein
VPLLYVSTQTKGIEMQGKHRLFNQFLDSDLNPEGTEYEIEMLIIQQPNSVLNLWGVNHSFARLDFQSMVPF